MKDQLPRSGDASVDVASEVSRLLGDLGVRHSDTLPRPPVTLDDVRAYLMDRIADLLQHHPALLMSMLYRIDVSESSVKNILAEASGPEIPRLLADLVIDRQLKKVRLRRQFGSQRETL